MAPPEEAVALFCKELFTSSSTQYDKEMAEFSARHEIAADTWTKKVLARMGKLSGMNGREKLITILHSMGFPLR